MIEDAELNFAIRCSSVAVFYQHHFSEPRASSLTSEKLSMTPPTARKVRGAEYVRHTVPSLKAPGHGQHRE
jgi:hypothetical protein